VKHKYRLKYRLAYVITLALAAGAPTTVAAPAVPVFGPASPVTALNSPAQDYPTSISPDGQKIVIVSRRNGRGSQLFSATRSNTSSPFSSPSHAEFVNLDTTAVTDQRGGVISPNGRELFYTSESFNPLRTEIMRATRKREKDPFALPEPESGLQVDTSLYFPSYVSDDGRRLYYWNSKGQFFVTSRHNRNRPFGEPSHAPFVNIPYGENFSLTPDELQMYYTYAGFGIYWSWRPDLETPFAPPQPLTDINALGAVSAPVIFHDTLYFGRGSTEDVYQATLLSPAQMARPADAAAPGVPEPSGVAALLLGAAGTGLLRRPQSVRPRRRGDGLDNQSETNRPLVHAGY
jgi:hypothetical protein